MKPLFKDVLFSLRHPIIIFKHFKSLLDVKRGNPLRWHLMRSEVAYFKNRHPLSLFLDCSLNAIEDSYYDFVHPRIFNKLSEEKIVDKRGMAFGELTILYIVIRILRPKFLVETGVARGFSTTVILQALEDNGKGLLYSIDSKRSVGDLVPENLLYRWKLIIGNSVDSLPQLLEDLREINFFLHDSEHTYENMLFEFTSVYPFMSSSGIISSHDITQGEGKLAFNKFEAIHELRKHTYQGLGMLKRCFKRKQNEFFQFQ